MKNIIITRISKILEKATTTENRWNCFAEYLYVDVLGNTLNTKKERALFRNNKAFLQNFNFSSFENEKLVEIFEYVIRRNSMQM